MEYLTDEDYEIALSNGISKERAYSRFYKESLTRTEAITKPVQRQVRGRYEKWKSICDQNGVSRKLFLNRCHNGWTEERAATTRKFSASERAKLGGIARHKKN